MQEKTLAQSAKSKPVGSAAKPGANSAASARSAGELSPGTPANRSTCSDKQEQRVSRDACNRAPQKRLSLRRNRHNARCRKQRHGSRPQSRGEHAGRKQVVGHQSRKGCRRNEAQSSAHRRRKLPALQDEERQHAARNHGDRTGGEHYPELRPAHERSPSFTARSALMEE